MGKGGGCFKARYSQPAFFHAPPCSSDPYSLPNDKFRSLLGDSRYTARLVTPQFASKHSDGRKVKLPPGTDRFANRLGGMCSATDPVPRPCALQVGDMLTIRLPIPTHVAHPIQAARFRSGPRLTTHQLYATLVYLMTLRSVAYSPGGRVAKLTAGFFIHMPSPM